MKVYTIHNFLSDTQINSILDFSLNNLKLKPARVLGDNLTIVDNLKVRKSSVAFYNYFNKFKFLKNKLEKEILEVLSIKGFDIDLEKDLQFTEYKNGEFYDWHIDSGDLNEETKNRFCSIVILLNDNYIGGDLQILNEQKKLEIVSKEKGNLFIFPSEFLHKVTTIENGIRYSLVGWFTLKQKQNFKKTII